MISAAVIVMSGALGQFYLPGVSAGYPPAYAAALNLGNRVPLDVYDPMRYNRFYSGEGFYTFVPPGIANPEVINFKNGVPTLLSTTTPASTTPPATTTATSSGTTGLVIAVDETKKQIKLQLPTGTTLVAYGPSTHFLASDGNFPVIKAGNLVNVNQDTITILRRTQQ